MDILYESLADASALDKHYKNHVVQLFDIDKNSHAPRLDWKSEAFNDARRDGIHDAKFYNFISFPTFEMPKHEDAEQPEALTIDTTASLVKARGRILRDELLSDDVKKKALDELNELIFDWVEKDKKAYLSFAIGQVIGSPATYDLNSGANPNDIARAVKSGKTVGWVSTTNDRPEPTQKKLSLYTKGDGNGMVVITIGKPKETPDTCYLYDEHGSYGGLPNKIKNLIGNNIKTFRKREEDVFDYKVTYFSLAGGDVAEKTQTMAGNDLIKGVSDGYVDARNLAYDAYSSKGVAALKVTRCDRFGNEIADDVYSRNNLARKDEVVDILSGKVKFPSMEGCLTYEECVGRLRLFKSIESVMKSHDFDVIIDSLIRLEKGFVDEVLPRSHEDIRAAILTLKESGWDLSERGFKSAIGKALAARTLYFASLEREDKAAGCAYVEWDGKRYYDANVVRKLKAVISSAKASGAFEKGPFKSSEPLDGQKVLDYCNDYIMWGMFAKCPESSPLFIPLMRRANFFGFDVGESDTEASYDELAELYARKKDGEDVEVESLSEGLVKISGACLTEANRQYLLQKSRNAQHYKDISRGKNRYERRMKSKISATIRDYNNIDMDQLFKQDLFEIKIPVMGETDVYETHIKISGLLKEIHRQLQSNKGVLEFKVILQSLMRVLNSGDVYIGCECPDFRYRMRYWATKNDYVAGERELRPSDITNPSDKLGAACKHVLLLLANLDWAIKVSSVLLNYVKYCKEHLEQAYADLIFPKIYGIKYDKAVQMDLFYDGFLPQDKQTRDEITRASLAGRNTQGRFVKDNPYKFQKQELRGQQADDPNQLRLNLDEPVEKELDVSQSS